MLFVKNLLTSRRTTREAAWTLCWRSSRGDIGQGVRSGGEAGSGVYGGVSRWDSVGYTIPAPAGTVQYVTGNFEV